MSSPVTDRHPFVKATLTKAIRGLLKDKHGHTTPDELRRCPECIARLWDHLGRSAPVPWIGGR